jgi:hypothetical protein
LSIFLFFYFAKVSLSKQIESIYGELFVALNCNPFCL